MESSLTASYLKALRGKLIVSSPAADRIIAEVREHLREAVEAGGAEGLPQNEAEQRAIARFGTPKQVARRFPPDPWRWAMLLLLGAAIATALPAFIAGIGVATIPVTPALVMGLVLGYLSPRSGMRNGMLPAVAFIGGTLARIIHPASSLGQPDLSVRLLLELPAMVSFLILGAMGGSLGARLRGVISQTA